MEKVVAEFPKNQQEKVVIGLTQFNRKDLFYLRVFFKDKEGSWHPTRKGVTLSVNCWKDFQDAFSRLKKAIEAGS